VVAALDEVEPLVEGGREAVEPGFVAADLVAVEVVGDVDVKDVPAALPGRFHCRGDLRVAAIDQFIDPVRLGDGDERIATDVVLFEREEARIAGDHQIPVGTHPAENFLVEIDQLRLHLWQLVVDLVCQRPITAVAVRVALADYLGEVQVIATDGQGDESVPLSHVFDLG